ncbi:MAG: TlpA disulfide reductase family protein [Planctomycetota bacterium]
MLNVLLSVSMVQAAPAADPVAELQTDVAAAYTQLDSLHMAGKLDYVVAYADLRYERSRAFTGDFASGLFLHVSDTGPTFANTGEDIFVYEPDQQSYQRFAAASGTEESALPPYLAGLAVENPALLLAATGGDLTPLIANGAEFIVDEGDGKKILSFERDGAVVTLMFDAETMLLRGREIDLRPALMADGVEHVTEGRLSLVYETMETGKAIDASVFAWKPPAEAEPAEAQAAVAEDPNALVGAEAPKFTLDNLAGDPVTLEDQRGKVVVLDFWATWCPPCREGLPHVAGLADRFGEDLRVFAVNQREDADTIQGFLDEQGIDVESLLDLDGAVGDQYGVTGIPTTVVIDRDGHVRHVLVGFGPDTPAQLDAAIEETIRDVGVAH